ncbi:helix-turn-helix transcriptional regulator [uncultured Treponema sp.]|jgi:transcriptional regulator, XRE family|uniref:helix-turn-helix domain-containing protein n=1 Tax=uncultured Treponema sp. TaxID=162155 RepID=UPI00207131A4|nr:helix-turn-helix transcriptional regulator [uncultured Treponema sp.]DAT90477.1 MAG TPA: Cro/C1-type HTH DNA-binding domain protein [Caudoviricetes sp.]
MSFSYKPLFLLLVQRNMQKMDLIKVLGISPNTLAKFAKNEYVSMDVLNRICEYFECRIEDVIEYVKD